MKALVVVFMFVSVIYSQAIIPEDSTSFGLCWNSTLDTSARYIVSYRAYSGDTTWRNVMTTPDVDVRITRTAAMRGMLVWGVRSVWYGDTSAMHTSMDQTACPTGGCDVCPVSGAWVMKMRPVKPGKIGRKR